MPDGAEKPRIAIYGMGQFGQFIARLAAEKGWPIVAAFNRAGIASAEDLRAMGADAAYARLLAAGERPHFIGYYVLHMALQGRPWNDCKGAEKAALRETFDRLVAGEFDQGRAKVESFMREIGLYEIRRG